METKWKIGLGLLVLMGIAIAFLTHRGVINSEIPVQFNPEPTAPKPEVCEPTQNPSHASSKNRV